MQLYVWLSCATLDEEQVVTPDLIIAEERSDRQPNLKLKLNASLASITAYVPPSLVSPFLGFIL